MTRAASPRSALGARTLALAALGVGFLAGLAANALFQHGRCGHYRFINPDFACGQHQAVRKEPWLAFGNDLRAWIEDRRAAGDITQVAVYFRDLEAGPIFGIDENAAFVPASLLKLPVVLTFLDAAREIPGLLSRRIVYSPAGVTHFSMPTAVEKSTSGFREGEERTVEELMRATIVHSDNLSYYLLLEHMNWDVPDGSARIRRAFQELGIVDPRSASDEVVTVRGYASLLRMLYNVSWLDLEDSEKVLAWLVETTFTKGIGAGVPAGVPVADKFGERQLTGGMRQLHDCGIVYFPGNPYLLCVMTRGADWVKLQQVIAGISAKVWKEMEDRAR